MPSYRFDTEAAEEYFESTRYYLNHASPLIAAAFVSEVEKAIRTLVASPTLWPVVDVPKIRRIVLSRFPYSIYYRWEPEGNNVVIYAVMHFIRLPGYWKDRLA